ncbi:MAG: thioredoxin family protein [Patescibacteria group bacterium]
MKVKFFTAIWCPACIVMRYRWEKIRSQYPELETIYFDYDNDVEPVKNYDIGKTLPVFIFIDNDGNEISRLVGEIDKHDLIKQIEAHKER